MSKEPIWNWTWAVSPSSWASAADPCPSSIKLRVIPLAIGFAPTLSSRCDVFASRWIYPSKSILWNCCAFGVTSAKPPRSFLLRLSKTDRFSNAFKKAMP